jgi:hypothetical protein
VCVCGVVGCGVLWCGVCVCVCVCVCVGFVMCGCVLVMCTTLAFPSSATLTDVFPCFFLSCKTNAREKLAKTGHGPQSS